jgi:dipeptidyl aminopeptidase/acylaminoacyl peptidase
VPIMSIPLDCRHLGRVASAGYLVNSSQAAALYRARSPIYHVDRLSCPIIFFQGLEDAIVPPDQTVTMVDALRRKGLPVAYMAFEGEQHGFRKAETIRAVLQAELAFYGKVFGFEPADGWDGLVIENVDSPHRHS